MNHHKELVTTNIRMPKGYIKALKQEALQKEKSVSFLLRELVKEHLGERGLESRIRGRARSIWNLPNLARKTGNPNLASDIDKIVYGA